MGTVFQRMLEHKLVAILRGQQEEDIVNIAQSLHDGGVHMMEITVDTPRFDEHIRQVKEAFGERMIVGAGTVLDPETARTAILAGAQFIFSPTVDKETITMAKRYGVVSIPGAMTPTEILTAYEQGADMIKVFPAGAMGPGYIKDVHGPLPHIPLMPTGGVDLSNVREYFDKGAVAAGLGSSLVPSNKTMDETALRELTETARQFSEAIKDVERV
ncbi:bifunctional 4-hydroxy-2-oxoglutarate aldolase/2-dehydro-3-deoxy-phosphogluconate aldolase [Halobacillus sp. ACCC02827]|uniref:bifunctional 4-hydroxy-2-oxoglutarate aldolase/2-dehydro-3-deoxy-phosphogluconate aldolase n=1 Tax=unclassified Halobacillus TaxID=2636472 RepID=UPI0002A4F088|nr:MULTISPECIES: bifunctional 4-hydroxy-2-oxoglutarate aldolase/2-dehydro-3-deoxy-phosphogluconate aldolase [unclassified Halobacillus]ELK46594.1 2-dehydro-3-deoxyphosphogluconate aldolase/4-hydroxy-2-oxoglutarate aldolase [Halobacillus sp. BAB-2008]WJE16304.1 bifunctional 4-hydroxy-2-oxoglutarate aldolase/2-dehydro-3-deoxy-phosphogluconate aldolase [Halobacillus sp. ACCC02827]